MPNDKAMRSGIRAVLFAGALIAGVVASGCGGGGGGDSAAVGPGTAANSPPPLPGDTTPPSVSAVFPTNNATGVATNTLISATFSETMTSSTLTGSSFTLVRTTDSAAVTGVVSVTGTTAQFSPSASLAPNTRYTGTITTAAKDAAGNALAANYTWNFTTAAAPDTTPPTVSATSPASGATGVALNASYTATFSELMTNATLTTASVKLATAGGTAVAGTVGISGNTVTFTPSVALAGSTQYTGTITTAAKDAAGNALAANYTWSFTTVAAPVTPAPTVSLTANPTSVTSGGSSTLTWTSTNATSCTASGAWSGSKAAAGSQSSGTLSSSSTFTLNCTGTGGTSGNSASITVTGASATSYTTNFPLTENPLSEGGKWVDGGTVGLDWNNPKTTSGRVTASVLLGASRYADNIAHLSGPEYSPNQYAQGTVYLAPAYSPPGNHEIELLLRFSISAHQAIGYEIIWGRAGYVAIVRWNGAVGDYTPLYDPGLGSIPQPVDGDVLRAEIVGNVIKVYRNGSLVASATNSTYGTGQPGIGFWPVDGATPENYGWRTFEAGNL